MSSSNRDQKDQGYASHPDNLKRHANVDQETWIKESEAVINAMVERIPPSSSQNKLNTFTETYQFLAEQRHRIAADLKQGDDGLKAPRTDQYGTPRGEDRGAHESIPAKDKL